MGEGERTKAKREKMKWWIPVLTVGIVAVGGEMSEEWTWQGALSVAVWVAVGLFFLKIAWDVLIPFDLMRRGRGAKPGERVGTSLMPYVEIGLWLVWLLWAFFSDGDGWVHRPKPVAVWGGGAILASYALMFAVGNLLGWFAKLLARENRGKTAAEEKNQGGGEKMP